MKKQMSESIRLGIVLAIAGGFMDAYSYMCRGKVFLQTHRRETFYCSAFICREKEWNIAVRYVLFR